MKDQKGVTLLEATVIGGVIILLITFMAPSISDFVKDAMSVKVKAETESIGVATSRLMVDIGLPCLRRNNVGLSCNKSNRADIIYSSGPDITKNQVASPDFIYYEIDTNLLRSCRVNWHHNLGEYSNIYELLYGCIRRYPQICLKRKINWFDDDSSHGNSLGDQFNTNTQGYLFPGQKYLPIPNNPWSAMGWRGAYLASPAGVDPWGNKYLVNSLFSSIPEDIDTCGLCNNYFEPPIVDVAKIYTRCYQPWSYDMFVISAGRNGVFETPFALLGAKSEGDDIIYVIQGQPR